jgi:hypothetical protein
MIVWRIERNNVGAPSLYYTFKASRRALAMSMLHRQFHASEATPSTGYFPPEAEPAHSVRHSSDKVEMGRY